jgi:hypothetical protein
MKKVHSSTKSLQKSNCMPQFKSKTTGVIHPRYMQWFLNACVSDKYVYHDGWMMRVVRIRSPKKKFHTHTHFLFSNYDCGSQWASFFPLYLDENMFRWMKKKAPHSLCWIMTALSALSCFEVPVLRLLPLQSGCSNHGRSCGAPIILYNKHKF